MGKLSTESQGTSRVAWDHLEGWVRGKVQELIQTLLEEEVTELLRLLHKPLLGGRLRLNETHLGEGTHGLQLHE